MTFISYAQNQEDVFLFRAFGHLASGFYVDVGANDPTKDSVTQAFYERGWAGINVDPVPYWHHRLAKSRKRDINLALAVSDQPGEFEFFEIAETGLSTFDPAQAEQYRIQGYPVNPVTVQTCTLTELFDRYAPATIQFLKIDVEGAEDAVIRGADWQRHRPQIILVESTLPNTNTSVHEAWEPTLLNSQYHFVWFDGINRFYVADECSELDAAFQVPVNVIDQYIPIDTFNLRTGARELQLQLQDLQPLRLKLLEREIEIHQLNDGITAARVAVDAAVAAANRLPCRLAMGFFKLPLKLARKIKAVASAIARDSLKHLHSFLQRHPELLNQLLRIMRSHPMLERSVRHLAGKPGAKILPPNDANSATTVLAPEELHAYRQITGS